MKTQARGATVVYGGSVGSEGKGAIVGNLVRRFQYRSAICSFMTNAGHTFKDGDEQIVVQQLPVSIIDPKIETICIGPGSAITIAQLYKELELYSERYNVEGRLRIHPRAMIIEEDDVETEQKLTKRVGSTMKGCGAALARKALRHPTVRLARDTVWLKPFIADTTEIVNDAINLGGGVMVEGSQGFDLDINHGIAYPECTSRQCTPQQTLADCGIDGSLVTRSVAVLRTYPIRVGNVIEDGQQVGYSGTYGANELSWAEITERSGSPVPLEERTTVTQRVRRVFEMDWERLKYMGKVCRPTDIALTFVDYLDASLYGQTDWNNLVRVPVVQKFFCAVEDTVHAPINILKTGPDDAHTAKYHNLSGWVQSFQEFRHRTY